jgi:hypothetical protein
MDYLLGTHEVGPQRIASIRSRCNQAALPGFIKTGIGELLETLRALDVDPCGPPFVIYHDFGLEASMPRCRYRSGHRSHQLARSKRESCPP